MQFMCSDLYRQCCRVVAVRPVYHSAASYAAQAYSFVQTFSMWWQRNSADFTRSKDFEIYPSCVPYNLC